MASENLVTNQPTDSLPVDEIDNEFRTVKVGMQDIWNADHYCTLVGSAFPSVANGAGQHRRITFYSVISTPTVAAGKVELYTKTADGAPELHYKTTADAERQLTLNGALNLLEADFATVVDGTSNMEWVAGVLTCKVDDSTIEYDGSNGMQQKIPAVGADASHSEACFVITGTYAGDGNNNRTITLGTGITVRHVVVKNDTDTSAAEMINADGFTKSWSQATGSAITELAAATNGFEVDDGANTNAGARTYYYSALCVRT